jgi:hypothetical protein
MGPEVRLNDFVDVEVVHRQGENSRSSDREESEAHLAKVEVVALDVDDGERLEEAVVDAIAERDIRGREANSGIKHHQLDRSNQSLIDDLACVHLSLVKLRL